MTWLKAKNPDAAARVGPRILDDIEQLVEHPYLGKPGRSRDTRELVISSYPFLIVYAVEHDETTSDTPQTIIILRVLHGAMQWPPEGL
jgi:toxin ParE1/3/4